MAFEWLFRSSEPIEARMLVRQYCTCTRTELAPSPAGWGLCTALTFDQWLEGTDPSRYLSSLPGFLPYRSGKDSSGRQRSRYVGPG